MKNKKITLIIILVIALLVTAVFFARGNRSGEEVLVTIPAGSGSSSIATALEDADVIDSAFLFRVYLKFQGDTDKIQAGLHSFETNMSFKECFEELLSPTRSGEEVIVTIPEGFEVHLIASRLEEKGVCSADSFMETVKTESFDYEFLKNLPDREIPLEGYLFPDTYSFNKNTAPGEVIRTMLNRFEDVLYTKENIKRANDMGYTFDEIVTMASVVEREAAGDLDRSKVSSVFFNRLNSSYNYLESCATVQYILGERKTVLTYQDTEIDSPYNTYQNPGLPIGPIASPGKAAFEATLYPADTEYLYFVVGANGEHIFSKTYEEHLRAQGK